MRFLCTSFRLLCLSALIGVCGIAMAQEGKEVRDPVFLEDSLFPIGVTQVRSIQSFPSADLVVLNSGHTGGLRQGMLLQVLRGEATPVAELILVAVRRDLSVALITQLNDGVALQSGDIAQIKFQSL
jgi:hypothetical protein